MKHNIVKQILIPFLVILAVGCAVKPTVFNDFDPQQDFSQYQTFSWVSDNPMLVQSDYIVSPFVGEKIMVNIKSRLQAKGYRFTEDKAQADIAISFTVGARDKIKVFNDPTYVINDWRWGREYWEPNVNRTTTINYVKGALAIDIFDTKRKAPIWHGGASKKLSNLEKKGSTENIAAAVETILANFPKR